MGSIASYRTHKDASQAACVTSLQTDDLQVAAAAPLVVRWRGR